MHRRFRFRFLLPAVSALALLAAAVFIGAGRGATSAQTPSPSATPASSGGTATSGTPSAAATGVPPEVSQNADQWPLANADYANTRSATGASITASNVGKLGVAWTFKIPTGAAQFGSAATNPIISGNTVYLQDLSSNVYAFDLQSGKMKWKKDFNQPASGPNGPGVAYGKVFVALNDGSIVALDANNGTEMWQTKLARSSSEGITIQVTPYNNELYVSTVPGTGQSFYKGGDTGVLYGLDQTSGNVLWHFDTVASNRWGNANINSGGGTWYPPAINTQTGQSFWGIGNPAPFPGTKDFPNGSSRPGPNLYTDGIVSLAPPTASGTPSASGSATTPSASGSGTPSASGSATTPGASGSGTASSGGTATTPSASSSGTPAASGTATTPGASGSGTPSASGSATTPGASGSGTPSASGTATTPSGPGVPGNATVAPTTGTPSASGSGTPAAAATPASPNCSAPSIEGGGGLGGQPPQGSSNSNSSGVALQGSEATLDWYRQVKPHDLFDLDFQMSPILTKATINGQQRDVVIGGGKGGYVVAFDQKTGDILWYVAVGQHMNDNLQTLPKDSAVKVMPGPLGGIETPMAYANGIVYVPVNNLAAFYTACGIDASKLDFNGGTGEFVAIDVNTGQFLWDKELPSANYGAATVVNDVVFTTTFDGTVYGFNAKTGDQVYKAQLPAGINGWPAVSGDTIIFPAAVGGTPSLVALRVGAGNPLPTPAAKATATGTSGTPGAGGAATTPNASGTASPAATGTASGTTASGASLTVVGQNIAFDKTTLTASAGKVSVTFENKDNGIPHNLHFFQGDSASGSSVATTAIKPGPASDTLTMNLKAGTYYYQCDVHPLQMHGTLTVH